MRIPGPEDQARVIPGVRTQVTRYDPYSELGSALQGLGEAARQASDERAAYQTAQARTAFIKVRTEQDSAFERDVDYGDLPERYEQSLNKQLSEISTQIANPRAREAFMEEQRVRIADGKARQQTRAFALERDTERARVNESLNALNSAALGAEDPLEITFEVQELLSGAVEAGYYSAEEAGSVERIWKDTYATNRIALMPPEKRLEALEQPFAENLPPEVRARLLDKAREDLMSERVIAGSERIWAETGGDYEAALNMAADIDNMDERLKVESRLTTLRTRQTASEREGYIEAEEQAWAAIEQGVSIDELDRQTLDRLGPQARLSLRSYQAREAEAARNNDQAILEAQSQLAFDLLEIAAQQNAEVFMMGPEAWPELAPVMANLYQQLSPTHHNELVQDLLKREGEAGKASEIDRNFNTVMGDLGLTAGEVFRGRPDAADAALDIADAQRSDKKLYGKRQQLEGIVRRYAREWTQAHGGADMTEKDRKEIARRAFAELDGETFKRLNNPFEFFSPMYADTQDSVREALREELGREPTEAEMDANMRALFSDG